MLLGMAYAPVAVIWAGSYVAGLGVAVGTGTTFTPLAVTDGPMPALPWLAALPEAAPRGGLGPGAAAGRRRCGGRVGAAAPAAPATTTTVLVGELVGVGAVCGAIWAGLAALAPPGGWARAVWSRPDRSGGPSERSSRGRHWWGCCWS